MRRCLVKKLRNRGPRSSSLRVIDPYPCTANEGFVSHLRASFLHPLIIVAACLSAGCNKCLAQFSTLATGLLICFFSHSHTAAE